MSVIGLFMPDSGFVNVSTDKINTFGLKLLLLEEEKNPKYAQNLTLEPGSQAIHSDP
jgi:hypothetical protein